MTTKLSRHTLSQLQPKVAITLPSEGNFALPEKILQFGTGVLLRGLCDYFVDQANKQGLFNGRIVIVKSTDRGDTSAFADQDNLYTICVQGIDNGVTIEDYIVNASVSRTLSAKTEWEQILGCARSADMQIVISNTTEVGIQYVEESVTEGVPSSFPAKLVAFLWERYQHFGGSAQSGMVIVPTELVVDNGTKLEEICLQVATYNQLPAEFITWLQAHNQFCNSLVDRIVPGKPDAETLQSLYAKLGYQDDLLAVAEVYRLWAIQGDEQVKQVLSFAQADSGVIIAPDIEIYRELKLRLLNGTHTLTCGLAYLCGKNYVRENMNDANLSAFAERIMLTELAQGIPYPVESQVAADFGNSVLNRFRNPFLKHKLLDITLHYSSKMKARNIPLLLTFVERFGHAPELFSLGFAAYLQFMKPVKQENGHYYGQRGDEYYLIQDAQASYFDTLWQQAAHQQGNTGLLQLVKDVLQNESLWGTNLTVLPEFEEKVGDFLKELIQDGALATLNSLISQEKEVV